LKKAILCLLSVALLFSSSLTVFASDIDEHAIISEFVTEGVFVEAGYTEDGIYYEIYDNLTIIDDIRTRASGSVYVERSIYFSGTSVTPQSTTSWTETINGKVYSGTLSLKSYAKDYIYSITQANYKGYLYN